MTRPLSDYERVACNRDEYELFGTLDALLVLTPGERLRFSPPLCTVELRQKWYGLFLLSEEASGQLLVPGACAHRVVAHRISWEFLPEVAGAASYVDHVPNPAAVRALCEREGYELDELAEELIEGRWQLEVKCG